MGAFKPLLPFGGQTVLGHVVASLREAGLRHIHVVTGHNADLMAPELASLGVTAVHNANFAAGMFTSVQAGVASLPAAMDGFLLLPVDVPLVRASTIRQVLRRGGHGGRAHRIPNLSRRARASAVRPPRAVRRNP